MAEQVGVSEEARQKDLEKVLNKRTALQELTAKEVFIRLFYSLFFVLFPPSRFV